MERCASYVTLMRDSSCAVTCGSCGSDRNKTHVGEDSMLTSRWKAPCIGECTGGEPVMWTRQPFRPQLSALALLGVALTFAACGNNDRTAAMSDNRAVGTSGTAPSATAKKPIDLTGCLQ